MWRSSCQRLTLAAVWLRATSALMSSSSIRSKRVATTSVILAAALPLVKPSDVFRKNEEEQNKLQHDQCNAIRERIRTVMLEQVAAGTFNKYAAAGKHGIFVRLDSFLSPDECLMFVRHHRVSNNARDNDTSWDIAGLFIDKPHWDDRFISIVWNLDLKLTRDELKRLEILRSSNTPVIPLESSKPKDHPWVPC
jgi:hypothetical protein